MSNYWEKNFAFNITFIINKFIIEFNRKKLTINNSIIANILWENVESLKINASNDVFLSSVVRMNHFQDFIFLNTIQNFSQSKQ